MKDDHAGTLEKEREMAEEIERLRKEIEEKQQESKKKQDLIYEEKEESLSLKANLERYQMMLDQNVLKKADYKKQLLIKKSSEEAIETEFAEKEKQLKKIMENIANCQKKRFP